VSPELLASFEELLENENIELEFFEGDWSSMRLPQEHKYDIVLTSETVYSLSSLPALLDLLESACRPGDESLCLVACKRIYFGVGGGELEFRTRVERALRGRVETVWGQDGQSQGVGRRVMKVEWAGK
jgi:protein-histidine N-methyltransferase